MEKPLEQMTDAELADWHYAHREELNADPGEPVEDLEISPNISITMSFRLSGAEADAIREAAAEAGVNFSEWIRAACASAVSGQPTRPKSTALDDALRALEGDIRRVREALGPAQPPAPKEHQAA